MNAKAEQKEKTHRSILQSAARLLREQGIAGARVAEVMKGAGLTVGGFYAHFDSKEALIDDVLSRTGADMRQRLLDGLDAKPEADRVEVVLKRYLSAAHRDEVDAGCPFPAVVGEVGTTAGEHRPAIAELVEQLVVALEGHLPSGGPTPRRHVALALIALMYGGLSFARALRGTGLSDEMLRACRAVGKFAVLRGEPHEKRG
jgi:TetR/AcrR family transcriptional regulator, transcriptional repressor for nem operon